MKNEKKTYAAAEIQIVLLDREMLELSANETLDDNKWAMFDFGSF